MRLIHWQDLGSSAVGAWLCVSPVFLGLGGIQAWAAAIFGLLVILFAIEGLIMPSYFEELFETVMGVALVVAPWSIGYDSSAATYSSVISGVLIVAFAISEVFTDGEVLAWYREHRPPMSS